MSSLIAKQQAFFSIQRLTEIAETSAHDSCDQMIEIYLVLNGQVTIAGKEFQVLLEDNNLYCITWNKYIRTEVKEGTAGYVIRFSKRLLYDGDHEFYCSYFSAINALVLHNEIIKVGASFLKGGKEICDMMYREFKCHNDFRTQILTGFWGIFLLHLMRQSNLFMYVSGNESQHTLVRKFNVLLEQHFKTNKRVSDYAALLFVTPNYLNGIIKQATGKPISYLIRQRVVNEAIRQAKLTGASMKEVAYNLGFNDDAHFSKFFKKAAGKNFSDLRSATAR
jgi:AraC family transcriptional activator of pobA